MKTPEDNKKEYRCSFCLTQSLLLNTIGKNERSFKHDEGMA
jgi:hypothetical protein